MNIDELNQLSERVGFADKFVALMKEELEKDTTFDDNRLVALSGLVLGCFVVKE